MNEVLAPAEVQEHAKGRSRRRSFVVALALALVTFGAVAIQAPQPVAAAAFTVSPTVGQDIANKALSVVGQHCSYFRGSCVAATNWCATFAQWIWIKTDPGTIQYMPTDTYAHSFVMTTDYGRYGTVSTTPHKGDAVVFTDTPYKTGTAPESAVKHVAIVVDLTSTTVTSVGGNEGGTDGLTSTVRKSTYGSAPGSYFGPSRYVYRYITPIVKTSGSISPASQTVSAGRAASWTVSWSGGSGNYTLSFNNGDGYTYGWSTSAAGSTTFSTVMSGYPCLGEAYPSYTQTFKIVDAKSGETKSFTSTTRVSPGQMC